MASDVTEPPASSELEHLEEASNADSWLSNFLYPLAADRTSGAILKWWERRRLPFNAIVGTSGLVTVALTTLIAGAPPVIAGGFSFYIAPILIYGVMANVCYSAGSLVEMTLNKLWGADVRPVGPALWRSGLIFSVGLTLVFPLIILITAVIVSFIGGIL